MAKQERFLPMEALPSSKRLFPIKLLLQRKISKSRFMIRKFR